MMMDAAAEYSSFLKVMGYYVTVGILAFSRWMGFFFFFPLMRWLQIPQTIQFGIAVAFSLPVWPLVTYEMAHANLLIYPLASADSDASQGFSKFFMAGLAAKEFVVGVLLGIFPAMFFLGMTLAGEIIDTARGDNKNSEDGNPAFPMGNGGMFLYLTGATIFIYSGEFLNVIRIMYDSYKLWPVHQTTEILSYAKVSLFTGQAVLILFHTVVMFIPMLVILQSVDIVTFFQAKIDKKFHGEDQGPVFKNLLFMGCMLVYMYLVNAHGYSPVLEVTKALQKVVYESP